MTQSNPDSIDISIEQAGNIIPISDDTAEIRRTKLSLIFSFSQPDGILINASFNPDSYNSAKSGETLYKINAFKKAIITEEPFNKSSLLYISDDSPNYWYYTDDTDHRFSSVLKSEKGYTCRREISVISHINEEGDGIPITDITPDTIYLIMVKIEWNKDYTRMIEKSRKLLKLKFII